MKRYLLGWILFPLLTAISLHAETEPNNSCAEAEVITALNGTTTDATASITGSVIDTADPSDYYVFTPNTSGTLTFTTSSPNNKTFKLAIGSSCDGTDLFENTNIRNATKTVNVVNGTTVYVRIQERSNDRRDYKIDFTFQANGDPLVQTSTTAPEIGQCGLFPSALTAYETLAFNASGLGSATTVLAIDNIVATDVVPGNPPGIDNVTCDGEACIVNKPMVIDYAVPFESSSNLAVSEITASTTISGVNAGAYSVTAKDVTVTFSPSGLYAAPSTRKYMSIASLDSTNKTGIKYIFEEGDYYIGSWRHQGNDLTIEVQGNVRIFLDGTLQFDNNTLSVNTAGKASQLLVFGRSDFIFSNSGSAHYDVNAFFYTKGDFILAANSNSGTGFVGAITSEHDISIENNQKFTYDPDGLDGLGFDACGWCQTQGKTSSGFYMVPFRDNGVDKTFELFCDATDPDNIKDLIALPIKNDSNNFVFNSDAVSTYYYDNNGNPRTPFHAIEINANTWKVKTDGGTTSGYNIMGERFSNINLIGTPFAIDWDNTTISNCTESKLRKAYYGQAVKINTLDYDKATCKIDAMQIKLLDDYRHLVYSGSEVLERTCKEMAEFVPDNLGILDDATVKGHFWIDPFDNNRADTGDIGADGRPIVAYCWYQQDLEYVWTFLLAMDAKVTVSKNDLTNKQDTCSEFGLNFFVPNTKKTFDRVRKFLLEKKSEWEDYTGTVEEKIDALHPGNPYYIVAEQDVKIWPYGPFGVYFPKKGDTKADGTWADWGGDKDTDRGYMSGSPMHNIAANSNYKESMGYKGWVSILGSQDLNKTDEWWIDDNGAGTRIDCSGGGCSDHYYEPNGNYTANAWLNFLYDSEGWVYHNDDWDNNYPYYDYMCMAEDNYDGASRYSLVPGIFTVVDSGNALDETALTTKIVEKPIAFDLLLYAFDGITGEPDLTQLETGANKSVGVFLSYVSEENNAETSHLSKYLGEYNDFIANGGRIPVSEFTSSSAEKKAFVTFFYCNAAGADWTDCWSYNGNADAPVVSSLGGGSQSDSYDFFAIRPDRFYFTTTSGMTVNAGADVDITFQALSNDAQPSPKYNEVQNTSFSVDVSITDPAKTCEVPEISITPDVAFIDGESAYTGYHFDEVGEYTVSISETPGAEFAAIDGSDTPDSDRLITPLNDTLKIIPDHFEVTSDYKDFGDDFTYLSNDLNMSSKLDLNITAKRLDGTTTRNYTEECYAKNFDLDVTHSAVPAPLSKIIYMEQTGGTTMEVAKSDPITFTLLPSSYFTSAEPGLAKLTLLINFDRSVNQPVNPFKFDIQSISATDADGATGSATTMQYATYYYGRSHLPRYRIENNQGSVELYYEVYCQGCDTTLLTQVAPNQQLSVDDIKWYQNENHALADGAITAINERSATTDEITETSLSLTSCNFTYSGNLGYPFKTMMQTTAPLWLIYSRFDAGATVNNFMLEFNTQGQAAGADSGASRVAPTTFTNTSRRINW